MIVFTYIVIAVVFVISGLGGFMYIDHKFALSVEGRSYAVKRKTVETDDPFVRTQFRKFYALRMAYSVFLLVALIVVVSYVG
ncbi:MAG: endonuclease [Roseibium sp.]